MTPEELQQVAVDVGTLVECLLEGKAHFVLVLVSHEGVMADITTTSSNRDPKSVGRLLRDFGTELLNGDVEIVAHVTDKEKDH